MRDREFDELVAREGAEAICERLAPYVTERRKARIDQVVAARLHDVQVAVEEPYDPHNAAAVVRSAEIFGAGAVHVVKASERILHARRTTSGAFHWVRTYDYEELDTFFDRMAGAGIAVAGACLGAERPLATLPLSGKLCLLFGNEHRGLSPEARERCAVRFEIPMYGFSESFNLSVSAALSLHDATRRRRAYLGRDGDLDGQGRAVERARYYVETVDDRLVAGMFPPHPASPTQE